MKPKIRLEDIVGELEMSFEEQSTFLNTKTGELVLLSDEELIAAEEKQDVEDFPEWQRENIRKAHEVLSTDDYLKLPGKFEINDYSIMEEFCYSVEDEELMERLLNGIHGSGAFRYFKDIIHEFGIVKDWYEFRGKALRQIAREWLESNGIEYIE